MDKKFLRNDLIVIGSLLLVTIITLVCVFAFRVNKNLIAKIHVQNEVVETIDLSKKEEKDYLIKGINGQPFGCGCGCYWSSVHPVTAPHGSAGASLSTALVPRYIVASIRYGIGSS